MKKIIVKDYYAIQRGKARSIKLNKTKRKEIARKAILKRWNEYEKAKTV